MSDKAMRRWNGSAWEGIASSFELEFDPFSAARPIVAADSGKCLYHPASDDNPRTVTIPANSSVPFPVGTVITIRNRINIVTVAITTDTLNLAGEDTQGSVEIAAGGIATLVKEEHTEWVISGVGIAAA